MCVYILYVDRARCVCLSGLYIFVCVCVCVCVYVENVYECRAQSHLIEMLNQP